jgi:hypothetical protein
VLPTGERRRGSAPWPAARNLAGATQSGASGHQKTRELYQMKEELVMKSPRLMMKTWMERGRRGARIGRRQAPAMTAPHGK